MQINHGDMTALCQQNTGDYKKGKFFLAKTKNELTWLLNYLSTEAGL
jgi:hypothetical protein